MSICKERPVKTALCTIAFRERTFEEVLDLACGAGFDGVEPWGKPDHIQSDWDAESVERSADEIKKRGLKVSQYGSYANPTSAKFHDEMVDAIEIAEGFETDKIRIWAGTCGSAKASEDEWSKAIARLKEFADRTAANGMTLVLEMHVGYLTDTVQGNLRLLEGVDRSNLRLNYQPLYTDSWESVLDGLGQIATFVSTVHAQNYVDVGSNERSLVSEGFVDYRTVVQVLRKAGFDGYLEVEFVREDDPEAALLADSKFLRLLCAIKQ